MSINPSTALTKLKAPQPMPPVEAKPAAEFEGCPIEAMARMAQEASGRTGKAFGSRGWSRVTSALGAVDARIETEKSIGRNAIEALKGGPMSISDMMQTLGKSEQTVKSYLSYARNRCGATITRYQRENDRLTKRVEKLESNNDHAQAHIARLEAQLTPQAKAERAFIL